MATTAGSLALDGHKAEVDATVVSALRDAGAVVVGKTNMHELAFGVTSQNATYGPVRNPLDPTRVAGGSSGGSAATVALGTVPFSLGTDTGGSVTIPAAFCGIVGFRPTTGRYPGDGIVRLSTTRDTIGLHARLVDDIHIVDQVITSTPPSTRTCRPDDVKLGIVPSRFDDLDSEVGQALETALNTLQARGVRLVDVLLVDDTKLATASGMDLVFYETERLLPGRASAWQPEGAPSTLADLFNRVGSPDVRAILETIAATGLSAAAYEEARRKRWKLRRLYADAFARHGVDALIGPTVHVLPPPLTADDEVEVSGKTHPLFQTVARNMAPGTVAGVPMLSIPGGWTATGLSTGLCLEGRFFDDQSLLAVGRTLESILGVCSAVPSN